MARLADDPAAKSPFHPHVENWEMNIIGQHINHNNIFYYIEEGKEEYIDQAH